MKLIKAIWHRLNYGKSKALSDTDRQLIKLIKASLSDEDAKVLDEQMRMLTYIQRWKKGSQGEVVTLSPGADVSFDSMQLPKFANLDDVFLLAEVRLSADNKLPHISVHLSHGLFRSIEYHHRWPPNIPISDGHLTIFPNIDVGREKRP